MFVFVFGFVFVLAGARKGMRKGMRKGQDVKDKEKKALHAKDNNSERSAREEKPEETCNRAWLMLDRVACEVLFILYYIFIFIFNLFLIFIFPHVDFSSF